MTTFIELKSGTLALRVERAEMSLAELCGFASRRSRKRGFVFVSKVLGKHVPVRPRIMAEVHARLAGKLRDVVGPTVVIALAETAIGLGQGIFDHWIHASGRTDLVFLHTTRYRLNRPLALQFEETHSHASKHLLHEPTDPQDREMFRTATSLVLVDDELSTGRTLANLTEAYRRFNPRLEAVHIVSITDWAGDDARQVMARRVGVTVHFHSLLSGEFGFIPRPEFDPGPLPDVVGKCHSKDGYLGGNFGRLGIRHRLSLDVMRLTESLSLRPGERILILGTGEFAHPPFLLARYLEQFGNDVHFQSTTRSPLLVGGDLASVIETIDNYHDDIPNYLYNVADRQYDRIVLCYETQPLPTAHQLPQQLGATCLFF